MRVTADAAIGKEIIDPVLDRIRKLAGDSISGAAQFLHFGSKYQIKSLDCLSILSNCTAEPSKKRNMGCPSDTISERTRCKGISRCVFEQLFRPGRGGSFVFRDVYRERGNSAIKIISVYNVERRQRCGTREKTGRP
ncbi:hypothetical protein F2P81_013712 [Scophthalmus maximus]|uniref:Uncharacterized protein n=1 Tax=Scophthalmus maximus TaxID=52904 RepID=A0A6A4SES4_SCOMX|nr:hypothetical protein F2P81_013712 [Scophthalmus maximus]